MAPAKSNYIRPGSSDKLLKLHPTRVNINVLHSDPVLQPVLQWAPRSFEDDLQQMLLLELTVLQAVTGSLPIHDSVLFDHLVMPVAAEITKNFGHTTDVEAEGDTLLLASVLVQEVIEQVAEYI